MKKNIAALSAAFVVAALMIFAPLLGAGSTQSIALEAIREMPRALNTSGNHVFAELYINDGTGVVTTPTDGGVVAAVAGAPLTAGETDGSGCITASATTGLFTIADACGVGEVKLTACLSNVHAGNTAKTHNVVFAKNGTALTTAPQLIKTEAVDAGAQSDMGCITTVQDAVLADTFGVYFKTTGATAEAATTRQATVRIEKVLNFSN
jgi:hypothetical protein